MALTTLTFEHLQSPQSVWAKQLRVQYRTAWTFGTWINLPNATLDFAVWDCSPSVGRAQFTYRYGYGKQPADPVFQTHSPIPLLNKYLRFYFADPGSDESLPENRMWEWYGVVTTQADVRYGTVKIPDGSTVLYGERTSIAYSMEYILENHRISRSYWWNTNDELSPVEVLSEVGYTFNDKDRFNFKGRGNRKNAKGGGSPSTHYIFSNEADAKHWSTRDIVEYLIRSGTGVPGAAVGGVPIVWSIFNSDLDMLPNWDKPEVESHLVSSKQILDSLISRRKLLTWWLEFGEFSAPPPDGTDKETVLRVRIATLTDSVITLPGNSATIPANTDTLALDFDLDTTAEIVEQVDVSHSVDQVIAYGAQRRNVITADFGPSLEFDAIDIPTEVFLTGWTLDAEESYESGGSAETGYPAAAELTERRAWNTQWRSRQELKNVYARFVLNSMIDYPPDDPDGYTCFFPNVKLQKSLPLYRSVDYAGSVITGQAVLYPITGMLEERKPIVLIEIPGQAGKYADITTVGRGTKDESAEIDMRDWSASVSVTEDGQSMFINVSGAPQHAIAFGWFTGQAEDENVHGQWEFLTIRATVSLLDERFAEGRFPADADIPAGRNFIRTIRVPAGDQYRLDWVRDTTIVDLSEDGTPITTGGGWLNDSRDELNDVAKSAFQWYSLERHALKVRSDWQPPAEQLKLGRFVKYLILEAGAEVVNAVITQITLVGFSFVGDEPRDDLPPYKFEIQTSFGELDFLHLRSGVSRASRVKSRSPTMRRRRAGGRR